MKKILLTILSSLICLIALAQSDVTVFLGKPVDGTKAEWKQFLIGKGYTPKVYEGDELFVGEFNGADVIISVVTTNNKVSRIYVAETNEFDEGQIKIRYNNLVNQFLNNERYAGIKDDSIPEDESISYEMTVHNKQYQAIFYQMPNEEKMDTLAIQSRAKEILEKKHPEFAEIQDEAKQNEIWQQVLVDLTFEIVSKKPVWFSISKSPSFGKYYITLFYDNEYNRAQGDDL